MSHSRLTCPYAVGMWVGYGCIGSLTERGEASRPRGSSQLPAEEARRPTERCSRRGTPWTLRPPRRPTTVRPAAAAEAEPAGSLRASSRRCLRAKSAGRRRDGVRPCCVRSAGVRRRGARSFRPRRVRPLLLHRLPRLLPLSRLRRLRHLLLLSRPRRPRQRHPPRRLRAATVQWTIRTGTPLSGTWRPGGSEYRRRP